MSKWRFNGLGDDVRIGSAVLTGIVVLGVEGGNNNMHQKNKKGLDGDDITFNTESWIVRKE